MRYILVILSLISSLSAWGQLETTLDSLVFELEEEEEIQCDSIIEIEKNGTIDCKLIFLQTDFNNSNKNLIVIPRTKVCNNDNSILFSNHSSLSKTILQLDYDTCHIRDFTKKDSKREYGLFSTTKDTDRIIDWFVEIDPMGRVCMDTQYHSARISKTKNDYIDFSCLHNVRVFELDLNRDNSTEIYLISYIWCASEIRIYRIDKNKVESIERYRFH